MFGTIDRFESDWVVIDIDGKTKDIERALVDPSAKEGDVVEHIDGVWTPNREETKLRAKRIADLANELWED